MDVVGRQIGIEIVIGTAGIRMTVLLIIDVIDITRLTLREEGQVIT